MMKNMIRVNPYVVSQQESSISSLSVQLVFMHSP